MGAGSSISAWQRSFAIRLDVVKLDVVKNDAAAQVLRKAMKLLCGLLADIEMAL
jgi:hypothetical protein